MANAVKRYRGEEHFVDGYVPQSMNAEYSSLHKSATWIGAGLVLASLAAWGIFIFGLSTVIKSENAAAAHSHGMLTKNAANYADYTNQMAFDGSAFMWGGLILALIMTIGGFVLVSVGRREYKAYKKEYGTNH